MAKQYHPPIAPRDFPAPRPALAELFVKRLELGWGDCDPAQIVYTGRLPDLALRALEAWGVAALGGNWFELNLDWGLDTPFIRLACDFIAPVTPRATLDCAVHVTHVGRTSVRHLVVARQGGASAFRCETVQVYVNRETFTPHPIPPNVRASIVAYGDAFPPPPLPSARAS